MTLVTYAQTFHNSRFHLWYSKLLTIEHVCVSLLINRTADHPKATVYDSFISHHVHWRFSHRTVTLYIQKTFRWATTGTIIETRALRIQRPPHHTLVLSTVHKDQKSSRHQKDFYSDVITAQHRTSTGLRFKKIVQYFVWEKPMPLNPSGRLF